MKETYEIPQDVQDKVGEDGSIARLENTLLKLWFTQAQLAIEELDSFKDVGFGFALQVAQQWGLSMATDIREYTDAFVSSSHMFWMVVVDAAADNPEALKIPTEGLDGEVNHDVYINIVNEWFKLAWKLQKGWELDTGLPTAYGIQDAMTAFIGQEPALLSNLNLVPGFEGKAEELWQPGQGE